LYRKPVRKSWRNVYQAPFEAKEYLVYVGGGDAAGWTGSHTLHGDAMVSFVIADLPFWYSGAGGISIWGYGVGRWGKVLYG